MAGGAAQPTDDIVSRLVREDRVPWYRKRNLTYLYFVMLPTCIGVEMTSGFDSSMMNGLQAVENWQVFFNHPQGSILGVLNSMYSLGTIAALPVVSWFADRYGRKMSILLGSVIMIIGAILQTATQNLAMFIISRFLLGLGIPFAIVGASSLIGELSHPKERAVIGSLFNASWFVGAIIAAGVTYGTFAMPSTWSWRIPSILQMAPSSIQIIFMWFVPESPRWLISKGRGEEAFAILAKYHAEGDVNNELVKAEYTQIETTLELEAEHASRSWKEVVATSGMRKRLYIASFLGLATQWSGNGLTSYYLSSVLGTIGVNDNKTKNLINLTLTCWGFINATVFALTSSRFKRRTIYLASMISVLLVFTGLTIASARFAMYGDGPSSHTTIAMIFLYSPAYNLALNALTYTYLVELFPFHVRTKGVTIFQAWGRCAGFFNQFVNPIGMKNAGWKYYISYCVFIFFEVLIIWFFFPETQGKTLEELSFLYEGDNIREEQAKRIEEELDAHVGEKDGKHGTIEHRE